MVGERGERQAEWTEEGGMMSNATVIDKLLLGGFLVSTKINNNNHARMYLRNKNDD